MGNKGCKAGMALSAKENIAAEMTAAPALREEAAAKLGAIARVWLKNA